MLGIDFKNLKKSWAQVAAKRQELAREIEEMRQRREWLQSAPLPLEEHLQRIDQLIDAEAAVFSESMRLLTQGKERKPFHTYTPPTVFTMHAASAGHVQRALCGLLRDEVKAGIRRAAQDWDYPPEKECGPSIAERTNELEQIERSLAEKELALAQFDDEIHAAQVDAPRDRARIGGKAITTQKARSKLFERWPHNEKPEPDDGVKVADGAEDMVNADPAPDEKGDSSKDSGKGQAKQ